MPLSLPAATFWIAVVLCAVAQLAILRSVLVARHVPAAGTRAPSASRRTEIAWAVIPALALAATLAVTWQAVQEARAPRFEFTPAPADASPPPLPAAPSA